MRRPGPSIMIAFGMPGHGNEQDEDALDREDRGGDDSNGDIATEAIVSIVHQLHSEGPAAIRKLRLFTDALGDMCQAYMDRDKAGIEDSAHDACEALRNLISD